MKKLNLAKYVYFILFLTLLITESSQAESTSDTEITILCRSDSEGLKNEGYGEATGGRCSQHKDCKTGCTGTGEHPWNVLCTLSKELKYEPSNGFFSKCRNEIGGLACGCLPVGYCGYMHPSLVEQPVNSPKKYANKWEEKELSVEEKKTVEKHRKTASDFFSKKMFREALIEIRKVFETVYNYKDSREIEAYAKSALCKKSGHSLHKVQTRE